MGEYSIKFRARHWNIDGACWVPDYWYGDVTIDGIKVHRVDGDTQQECLDDILEAYPDAKEVTNE